MHRSDETMGDERPEESGLADVRRSDVPPWEMIAPGRYMPRRIRGSFHGRELG
jgi:hypothetical protein